MYVKLLVKLADLHIKHGDLHIKHGDLQGCDTFWYINGELR